MKYGIKTAMEGVLSVPTNFDPVSCVLGNFKQFNRRERWALLRLLLNPMHPKMLVDRVFPWSVKRVDEAPAENGFFVGNIADSYVR
jgi:hypothetical protein